MFLPMLQPRASENNCNLSDYSGLSRQRSSRKRRASNALLVVSFLGLTTTTTNTVAFHSPSVPTTRRQQQRYQQRQQHQQQLQLQRLYPNSHSRHPSFGTGDPKLFAADPPKEIQENTGSGESLELDLESPFRNHQQQRPLGTYSPQFLEDNGLTIITDGDGFISAKPAYEVSQDNNGEVEVEVDSFDVSDDDSNHNTEQDLVYFRNSVDRHYEDDDDEDDFLFSDFEDFDYTFLKDLDSTQNTVLKGEPVQPQQQLQPTPQANAEDINGRTSNSGAAKTRTSRPILKEQPVPLQPLTGFNVVLTHCTADFDSLASAVGLAKLWSSQALTEQKQQQKKGLSGTSTADNNKTGKSDDDAPSDQKVKNEFDSSDSHNFPTFVVLPRGAHPSVQRFLALHKHLFPIRSLKSLPPDLSKLNRLALVDAQRRDRIGPAEHLLQYAKRVIIVDHHVDMESDIPEATDYVVDKVGSVSTLIVERLMKHQQTQLKMSETMAPLALTEAEATLLALGIHADTGSLCYDSTTPRDAAALAWVMAQGASQVAIAEHAQSSLSREQQGVLTQALVNTNSTVAHGVTISTVLLTADGFIQGLAAVTQDALEISSSDVYLLGLVYEPKSGGQSRNKKKELGERVKSRLLMGKPIQEHDLPLQLMPSSRLKPQQGKRLTSSASLSLLEKDGELRKQLRDAFDRKDLDGSGCLNKKELSTALAASGIVATQDTIDGLMETMDSNEDGRVDFEEFVKFAKDVQASVNKRMEEEQEEEEKAGFSHSMESSSRPVATSPRGTLIIIGRAKPGVNVKAVKLGKLLEKYGGGGHPKAASATVRLNNDSEAAAILSGLVDELIETSLKAQPTVGDFMTSPVLSVKAEMTEPQVEDLFTRYDVRALPVVNEHNDVIGLVTYKEVAAAKQRIWNKEQKRLREEAKKKDIIEDEGDTEAHDRRKVSENRRRNGSTVKAWMKQHITTVQASQTMAEVEAILLGNDVGCIPVVQDGTMQLVGMVTRTDLLRQHRYYPSLHYNNKGMSDSIAARQPIIALRKKLKQFDLDE